MGSNGAPMGVNGKILYAIVVIFLCFYGKHIEIIGLKAPGDYSDQFWSNNFSILLCEGPKPPNSMIS